MVATLWVCVMQSKIGIIDCLCTSKVKVLESPRTAWPVHVTEQPKLVLACVNCHSPNPLMGTFGSEHGPATVPSRHLTSGLWENSMVGAWAVPWHLMPVDEMVVLGTFDGLGHFTSTALPMQQLQAITLCSKLGEHIWPAFQKSFLMWAQLCHDIAMALGCFLECSGYVRDWFCHVMCKAYYQITSQAARSPATC